MKNSGSTISHRIIWPLVNSLIILVQLLNSLLPNFLVKYSPFLNWTNCLRVSYIQLSNNGENTESKGGGKVICEDKALYTVSTCYEKALYLIWPPKISVIGVWTKSACRVTDDLLRGPTCSHSSSLPSPCSSCSSSSWIVWASGPLETESS